MSGPSKSFANQQERKAFFTRPRKQKQFPQYASAPGGNPYMGNANPSFYAQQPFQPVFFMSNYGPTSQYAFIPGSSPWMVTAYGSHYAQQPQPIFYAPNYGPPSQSQFQVNVSSQGHLQYEGSQDQAGPDMPQYYPMFQYSQSQDPSTLHHGQAYPSSGLFDTDAVASERTDANSPSSSSATGFSTANSSHTPSSSVSAFTKGQHMSKASEIKRKVSTETMDALKKPKLQPDSALEMSNHLKTPAQHTPKHKHSSALDTTSIPLVTPNTHDVRSRHQRCAVNDPSKSQSPAGKAAEPGKETDAVQSKHQSLVVNSASEAQAVADRAAELQKNAHAILANHQQFGADGSNKASPIVRATYASCLATLAHTSSSILDMLRALGADESVPTVDLKAEENTIMDDASETQCLAGNAAEPKQNTNSTKSEQQSLVIYDASKPRLVGNAAEPRQDTNNTASGQQSLVMHNASETHRMNNAAQPQQNTIDVQSGSQSPFANDPSKSQTPEEIAAEAPKKTDTPTLWKTRKPKKRMPRMLQGLASTLKVDDEVPMRRPRRNYVNCFPVQLPGIGDEDQEIPDDGSSYEEPDCLNGLQAMGEISR